MIIRQRAFESARDLLFPLGAETGAMLQRAMEVAIPTMVLPLRGTWLWRSTVWPDVGFVVDEAGLCLIDVIPADRLDRWNDQPYRELEPLMLAIDRVLGAV